MPSVAENRNHTAQQFIFCNGGICEGKGIAARDQRGAAVTNYAMRDEEGTARENYDLSDNDVRNIYWGNCKNVSGPNAGEHTGPANLEAHLTVCANHLRN